jgi:hypothetical protein
VDPAVADEARSIAQAFEGGPLAGRDVEPLTIPNSDEVAFAVGIDPGELRDAWRDARGRLDRLGRWPVAATAWDGDVDGDDLFDRHFFDGASPAAVLARARELTVDDALARLRQTWPDEVFDERWEQDVDAERARTIDRVGTAPPREELLALRPDAFALERRLLEAEEAERPTTEAEAGDHLDWFEPDGQPVVLTLVPTRRSAEAAAYLSFFGADGLDGHAALVRMLERWEERHGAELVASWGTMLQLTVARPPTDVERAFELATEQVLVAYDTIALPHPDVTVRAHARALLGRPEWFLHDRP